MVQRILFGWKVEIFVVKPAGEKQGIRHCSQIKKKISDLSFEYEEVSWSDVSFLQLVRGRERIYSNLIYSALHSFQVSAVWVSQYQ